MADELVKPIVEFQAPYGAGSLRMDSNPYDMAPVIKSTLQKKMPRNSLRSITARRAE